MIVPVVVNVTTKTRERGTAVETETRGTTVWSERPLSRGAWVAQSVERPTSAQVMNSRSVGSSPASGSVLRAQSLGPAYDSVSPSLSASLSLSQK